MPGASAPSPGALGADLYQRTFASPSLRPSLRFSGSSPPAPLPSPLSTGASLAVAVAVPLLWATGFLSSSPPPPLVTAQTVPPTSSSTATAAPTIIAGFPLKGFRPPPGGGVGAPGKFGGCCG